MLSALLVGAALAAAAALGLNSGYVPTPQDTALLMDDALTKTTTFTGTAFDQGEGFQPGGVGMPMNAVVDITALTVSGATFTATLYECDTSGGSYTACSAAVAFTATGIFSVPGVVSKRYLKLVITITGGSSPSVTYSSWANPLGFATLG